MKQNRFAFVLSLLVISQLTLADANHINLLLPKPDGTSAVGIKSVVMKDAKRKRDLLAQIWYPALENRMQTAQYMDTKTGQALAEEWQLKQSFETEVRAHGQANAPFRNSGPFPVVLLEHGSGMVPALYTVVAEELASSGFIVVAANHTPDSLISVFPDGHEVRFTPYWPEKADRKTQGEAITRFTEETLVPDVRFILDELAQLQIHDDFWRNHFDLHRIGIAGHSMGGTTAALALQQDSRILAGVNLDGSTFPGMNHDVRPVPLNKPFLFLMTEEHGADPGTHGREYVGSKSNTYYVVIPQTDHMSFTDGNLINIAFSVKKPRDDKSYHRAQLAIERTRSLVKEFFAKYLQNQTAPNLDLPLRVDKR